MQRHPSQASWTQFLKMPTDELWNNVSIRVRSRLCDCRDFCGFLAERFFVVSILVSTRGLFRKCCPTQRPVRAPGYVCSGRLGVGAFSSRLRGSKLVPAKRRSLVPGERRDGAQSRPPAPQKHAGHNTSREALRTFQKLIR